MQGAPGAAARVGGAFGGSARLGSGLEAPLQRARQSESAAAGLRHALNEMKQSTAWHIIGAARFVSARPDVDRALNLKRVGLPLHFIGYAKTAELVRGCTYMGDANGCLFAEKLAP